MDKREFLSEEEYFAGRAKDGGKPVHHSRKLTDDPTKLYSEEPAVPPVADDKRTPQEKERDRLHYEIDRLYLDQLDMVLRYGRRMMEKGFKAMDGVADDAPTSPASDGGASGSAAPSQDNDPATAAGEGARATHAGELPGVPERPYQLPGLRPVARGHTVMCPPAQHDGGADGEGRAELREEIDRLADVALRNELAAADARQAGLQNPALGEQPGHAAPADVTQGGPAENQGPGLASRPDRAADPDKPLNIGQCIAMGERGAKLVFLVSEERAKIAHKLVDMAGSLDTRKHFMWDRAIAVVYATLLHLDETLSDVGFGAWMPFRWPDQWLSFCGVLTRVLAANGLLHSKYADVYRKLLDETPPVEFEGTVQDRIKETRTPHNIAQCKWNQGAYTMSELKTRLEKEVWEPADQFKERWSKYWEDQLVKPPVPRRDGTVKPPYVPPPPPPKEPPPG